MPFVSGHQKALLNDGYPRSFFWNTVPLNLESLETFRILVVPQQQEYRFQTPHVYTLGAFLAERGLALAPANFSVTAFDALLETTSVLSVVMGAEPGIFTVTAMPIGIVGQGIWSDVVKRNDLWIDVQKTTTLWADVAKTTTDWTIL